jgi:very-short-patch-repair endonuclease/DNA modification methylase
MPLQKVEAIDEPRSSAEGAGDLALFEKQSARLDDFRNMLIWGDNKLIMASLLRDFKGKIDLIYIDPPFDVGADFTMDVPIADDSETLGKEQSLIEFIAYRDMWGRDTDSYLHMMFERFILMKDLLSERGSIYVHCDWHVGFLLRALLDERFGKDNFLNEIVWYYYNKMHDLRKPIFPRTHDTIISYSKLKRAGHAFNQQKEKRDEPAVQLVRKKVDGRMVNARDEEGNVLYRTTDERTIDDVWRIPMIQPADKTQNTGFITQKNERVLERVIAASSNEGDLVADFFCVRAGTKVWMARENSPTQTLPANGEGMERDFAGLEEGKRVSTLPVRGEGRVGEAACTEGSVFVAIEAVRAGDLVISHDGHPHAVLATFHRPYTGRMVGIRHNECGETLWLTADHRVLAKRRPRSLGGDRDWSGSPPESLARRRQLRRDATAGERRLWSRLRNRQMGWKFRRQHPIGPYIADFYCREAHLAVEVDGDPHYTAEAMTYDQERDRFFSECGVETVRIPSMEIWENLDGVLEGIWSRCRERCETMEGAEWVRAEDLRPGDTVFFLAPELPPLDPPANGGKSASSASKTTTVSIFAPVHVLSHFPPVRGGTKGGRCEAVQIAEIETLSVQNEVVYDLRVEDSHSFQTEVCMVHNCGSGTTGAVAEKLGRRWILCDLGRFAIHTSRKRMIEVQRQLYRDHKPYRAFDVYNLGRYERQWWQKERLKGADAEHRAIVLAFYRAEPLTGASSPLLHGRKGPAFVHVDSIDSILTADDLKPVVEATKAAGAKEVHCLAWEFEMELKHNAEALEHEYGVRVRLIRIPREVMEKNRRPGVDNVPFFEMATLTAEPIIRIEGGERIADVKLTSFLPSLSEVSSKELEALQERALRSGFDFIDFWAVDFDHRNGEPFKHHWQDYRLRKDRSLKTVSDCGFVYKDAKAHTICVKVIDTFGCDTSLTLEVPGAKRRV